MESAVYSIFRVDVRNLVKNKLFICKEYHIQPSEIDRMCFYEYEYMLEDIKEIQKQQEKQREDEEKKYGDMNPQSMMSSAMSSMKSMSQSSFKAPNFNMPKF